MSYWLLPIIRTWHRGCLGRAKNREGKSFKTERKGKHCRALPSTVEHCQALPSNEEHCQALPSFAKHCQALPSTAEHCQALQGTP